MRIGIPKEILPDEGRVAATPATVSQLCALGYEVVVQSGAGSGIFASDTEYALAGAQIVAAAQQVLGGADVVLKVKQPAFNENLGVHEVELLKAGSTLIAFLHPAAPSNHTMVRRLAARNITCFSMDAIPRITRAQPMDALTSMSTVTGYRSVLSAALLLPRFVPLMGTVGGVIKPAGFLVVGAGVVGLQAVATARRLGATVVAVDIRPEAREESETLGAKVAGYEVPLELALGEGGYARSLPEEWLQAEREALAPLVAAADVVVLSALVPGEVAPPLLTAEMVAAMRPGSVVVDVSIDQGGNCALTQAGSTIVWNDVTISGVQNIPGRMPVDASWLYAQNILCFLQHLFKEAPGSIDWSDEIVRSAAVIREGAIVHAGCAKAMSSPAGAGRPAEVSLP